MGKCLSKSVKKTPAPKDGVELNSADVYNIISAGLRVSRSAIKLADGNYFAYSLDELRSFLNNDIADKFKYKKSCFDCDDFALVVAGREREWYMECGKQAGSTFGIVWGDVRRSEDDNIIRPHAVNCFIDETKELWLIEPQTDEIFKPTRNSTFWMVIV